MNDTSSGIEKSPEQVNSRHALGQLLSDMISFPERRAEIAQNIEDTFGQCKAVLALDMSGFSRTTQQHGILPADRQLYVAFGIGYGKILNIGNENIFGDEMNLACKLGEDIAERGEILLTPAAKAELNGLGIAMREGAISISGIHLNYYYVER